VESLRSIGEEIETMLFYMVNNCNEMLCGSSVDHDFGGKDIWDKLVSVLGVVSFERLFEGVRLITIQYTTVKIMLEIAVVQSAKLT
jgi:hypothetical protein